MWIVFLVPIMVFLYSFQALFTRLYSANYAGVDSNQSTPVFSVCYGLFIGFASLIAGLARNFSFAPTWQTWACGLTNAVMLFLYNTSMIESGNRGSYSFLMIASMSGGILVPLIFELLRGQPVTPLQGFAMALMIFSFVIMHCRGLSLKGSSGLYYFWCAVLFLSNGMYAVFMSLQTELTSGMQSTEMNTILFTSTALIAAVFQIIRGQGRQLIEGFRMGKKAAVYLLICCASATAAVNLLLLLLPHMTNSVLYTIDNGGVLVLSIVYSFFLFKERPKLEQWIGMLLALISIVLISL